MSSRLQFGLLAALLLAGSFAAPSSFGQRPGAMSRAERRAERRKRIEARQNKNNPPSGKDQPQDRQNLLPKSGAGQPGPGPGAENLPPKWAERLQQMTPEEQERFLQNNERFRSLPPEQQERIRQRLRVWNSLSQDQRDAIIHREELWQRMTPEQQQKVRREILPRWQALPQDRRHVLVDKLGALQNLNDTERAARLNDPAFMKGLNPDEQKLLRDMSDLRIGPGGGAAPQP